MVLAQVVAVLLLCLVPTGAYWSFQQSLKLDGDMPFYADFGSNAMSVGRGFETIISGYDATGLGSVFVHNTDDGYAGRGYSVWTQNAQLVPVQVSSTPCLQHCLTPSLRPPRTPPITPRSPIDLVTTPFHTP